MNKMDTPLPAESEAEFETVEFMQKDAPDVRFQGRLLGEIDSRDVDTRRGKSTDDRFTTLELYELPSGKWVAARVACSKRAGEVDIADVTVLDINKIELEFGGLAPGIGIPTLLTPKAFEMARRTAVLQAFGWTWLAKEFATKMGWEHVQELA